MDVCIQTQTYRERYLEPVGRDIAPLLKHALRGSQRVGGRESGPRVHVVGYG
jgi:hypothetical protein